MLIIDCFGLVLFGFWLCCVQKCEPTFYLSFGDLNFDLVWSNCDCVIHPEVTLCSWGDVKIQELSTPLKYCPEGTLNGSQDIKIKASTNPVNSWRKWGWPHLGWGCRTALPSCTLCTVLILYWKTIWGEIPSDLWLLLPTFASWLIDDVLERNWVCA